MKPLSAFLFYFFALAACSQTFAAPAPAEPEIESVSMQASNVVIRVRVDAGYARLIYETKVNLRSTEAWVPRKSQPLSGDAETVEVIVPINPDHGCFRIRCFTESGIDRDLLQGVSDFAPRLEGEGTTSDTPSATFDNTDGAAGAVADRAAAPETLEVTDADIWAIKGDRVYFFNRYRGLQIMDISNSDAPLLLDTLDFAGNGERMFALPNSEHVVLISNSWCSDGQRNDQHEAVIIDVTGDQSTIISRLPLPGRITESRLIGDSLFTGSTGYFPTTETNRYGNAVWETRTHLTSFDLSDPATAQQVDQIEFAGYQGSVRAFTTHIVVVTHNWYGGTRTQVSLVAIDPLTATMTAGIEMDAGGRIRNEYMINIRNDVLSIFVEDTSTNRISRLSNYDLNGRLLGQVEVGAGESLFSTRFHGDTVYAVTFRRIDPLWIIDNRDPSNPTVSGELEVPGFSTYIEPFDGQVLTIGTESGQVAVSLFDTSDTSNPSLLSRIKLGERYSWSEAQYEEQAFQVQREAGLVMLPFYANGARGLQFIEFGESNLVERGIVLTPRSVRRSAHQDDRVFAVSAEQLLVIDPTDLDHPMLLGQLELARQVSRVLHHNDHLIEIDSSQNYFWGGGTPQAVGLSSRTVSNEAVLASLELDALNLLGVAVRDNLLYLLQGDNHAGWFCCLLAGGDPTAPSSNLVCTVVDLSNLPAMQVLSRDAVVLDERPYGSLEAHWPNPDTLVWAPTFSAYNLYLSDYGSGGFVGRDIAYFPYFYSGKELIAYDTTTPSAPTFASMIRLGEDRNTQFGGFAAADGKMFTGYKSYEFIPDEATNTLTNTNLIAISWSHGQWVSSNSFAVIDYLDPTAPVQRPPTDMPGSFAGISPDGRICYTREFGAYDSSNRVWGTNFLHALAYDDVELFLVASLPLTDQPNHSQAPLAVNNVIYQQVTFEQTNQYWTCSFDASSQQWTIHDRLINEQWRSLSIKNDLLILSGWPSPEFYSLQNPLLPTRLPAVRDGNSCFYASPSRGDGSVDAGFFTPNGLYGIERWVFE